VSAWAEPNTLPLILSIRSEAGRLDNVNTATDTSYRSEHPRVRVLVADDHEVMRLGIRNLLEVQPGWSVCAEASNGQEAIDKTVQFHPDVIIMDISMPVMNGIDAANQITRTQPKIPVILFSLHLSDDLYPHFQTDGIRGAVAKGHAARDLVQAVETVLGGGTFFPDRKTAFS
jgi:two-component system, NarL family, nitrate/nitrite response regulator NarL